MSNYYFLISSLPPLVFGERPDISFEDFEAKLELNLNSEDLEKAAAFRSYIDLQNIRSFFLEEAIDPRGNLSESELDQALIMKHGLDEYIFDFLGRFDTVPDKIRNFSGLFPLFFLNRINQSSGFVKDYFAFERSFRLVQLALRSKFSQRDVRLELEFEDPEDPLVSEILAQKDADAFEPPHEFLELKEKFIVHRSNPMQLNLVLAKWRFDKMGEFSNECDFSIDSVLCYFARLMILEQISDLNEENGKMILHAFVG